MQLIPLALSFAILLSAASAVGGAALLPTRRRPIEMPSAALLEAVARKIEITDHEKGETFKWTPNEEQLAFWKDIQKKRWTFVLKGRQIGLTTAQCLVDLLFVALNAARGHVVECWLVWDKEENVQAKIALIANFARQLGIKCRSMNLDIEFPNGSAIRGLTAGGKRVGASRTCHFLHMSEMPNWPDAGQSYDSVISCLVIQGFSVIETTMLVGQETPKGLWREPNRYQKVFYPVEMHGEYKAEHIEGRRYRYIDDEIELSEHDEKWLRSEGFTDLCSMAWMIWALKNKVKGADQLALMREYPQEIRHCFALAKGRWVRCDPPVLEHRAWLIDGKHLVKVYREPADYSHQGFIGIDTSAGLGKSKSTACLFDKRDGRLVASFADPTASYKEAVYVALHIQRAYTHRPKQPLQALKPKPPTYPLALIEDNGIGGATVREAQDQGLVFATFHQTDERQLRCMQEAREKVEDGTFQGPKELADECDGCSAEEVKAGVIKFEGPKDLLMTGGICYVYAEQDPYRPPAEPDPSASARFMRKKAGRGGFSRRL